MLLVKKTAISFIITFFFIILGISIKKFNLTVTEITEQEKCPACFGISMCQEINDNKVHFEFTDFYSVFNNIFSIKNVYYGRHKNKKIIMKKLAHKSELDDFDKMICQNIELFELCYKETPNTEIKTDFYKLIVFQLTQSNMNDPNTKVRLCPSKESIDELLLNLQIKHKPEKEEYYKYLWTSIKINPEPIILQILSARDGWPTPEYYGACGRVIIQEYVGLPLLSFTEDSWIIRAKIASSLLDAAYLFTFKNPKFAFYLTDISMDNIAIDNKYRAIFIDLENIIIVDKYPPIKDIHEFELWNQININDIHPNCQDCFIFSPTDICTHKISDHNYYAICQHILLQNINSGLDIQGFLHNPPEAILKEYTELIYLLKQCSKPSAGKSRIDSGIRLKTVLDLIIKNEK